MKLAFIGCALLISVASAYDNFQGLGRLQYACFPVYDHKECNLSLANSYEPPNEPASDNPLTTKLYLFTPTSQDRAEQLHQCAGGLPPNSTFDAKCPTHIIISGYSDGVCRTAWMRETKEQLFLRSDCYNVILVDWTWGNFPDPVAAVINSKVVGQQVAYVLKKIARQVKYDCKKFHIVGLSDGAISASYAGKYMQRKCRLGVLTTLDYVLRGLKNTEADHLNPTDALLVVAVHTNSAKCFSFNIGNPAPLGHINFYVNDGTHQYSCFPYAFQSLLKLDFFYALASLVPPVCSHMQSTQYYKASILANTDDTQLIGVQCESKEAWTSGECERNCEKEGDCLPMGLDTSSYVDFNKLNASERKSYYVPTTLMCPYADHSGFTGLPLQRVNERKPPI